MQVDLTILTAGQIAAIATIIAATVAATSALIVALLNAWSARRVGRMNSRREYYLKMLGPMFDRLDSDIVVCSELADFLVPAVSDTPTINVDEARFESFRSQLYRPNLVDGTPMQFRPSSHVANTCVQVIGLFNMRETQLS